MTFSIVFKRNDIQNCISRKWHSDLVCGRKLKFLNISIYLSIIFKLQFEVITECSDTEQVVFSVQENVWSADSKLLGKKRSQSWLSKCLTLLLLWTMTLNLFCSEFLGISIKNYSFMCPNFPYSVNWRITDYFLMWLLVLSIFTLNM